MLILLRVFVKLITLLNYKRKPNVVQTRIYVHCPDCLALIPTIICIAFEKNGIGVEILTFLDREVHIAMTNGQPRIYFL